MWGECWEIKEKIGGKKRFQGRQKFWGGTFGGNAKKKGKLFWGEGWGSCEPQQKFWGGTFGGNAKKRGNFFGGTLPPKKRVGGAKFCEKPQRKILGGEFWGVVRRGRQRKNSPLNFFGDAVGNFGA